MKIFDNDRLTEEGRHLCADADIRPEDIKIKTFDDFKAQVGHSEVAEIRFNHYQNKRLSKLSLFKFSYILQFREIDDHKQNHRADSRPKKARS